MFWHSLFGTRRYKWIFDKVENNVYENKKEKKETRLDSIMRTIVGSWNPDAPERDLQYLFRAIELRQSDRAIFSLDLICGCVDSIEPDEKYFLAWGVIRLMTERLYDNNNMKFVHHKTIKTLEIGINFIVKKLSEKNQNQNQTEGKIETKRKLNFILLTMNMLLPILKKKQWFIIQE